MFTPWSFKAFALTGRWVVYHNTQGDALGEGFLPFQGVWGHDGVLKP